MQKRAQHLGLGVTFALLAGFAFSALGASIKLATATMAPPVVLWGRQFFSLVAISPWLGWWAYRDGPRVLLSPRWRLHIARAFFSLGAGYCVVFSLSMIPLSDAITLNWTRPLWLPLVIWIWLGKRMEGAVWIGLAMGFVGVALILQPGITGLATGSFVALLGGLFGSMAILLIRRLTKTEPPARIMGYYFAITIVASGLVAFLEWKPLSAPDWWALAGIGVLGTVYQFFLTLAYRSARATLVSSVLYSGVVFTLFWDAVIWGVLPDWWSVAGIALVIAGAIVALLFSRARAAPGEQPVTSTENDKNS